MKRALIFTGAGALVVGLAFLVARPSADPPAATPYAGARGASRAKASGLAISVRRNEEIQALVPGAPVRGGDALRFAVRAEHPRHLIVRLRDGAQEPRTIFPVANAGQSALVSPGQTLPVSPTVTPGAGKVVVTAILADHPFSLDARGDDTEELDVVMEKEP